MSSLELNKIAGAVLVAGLVALVSGILANMLVQPEPVQHAAVAVPEGEEAAEEPAAPAEEAEQPIALLLASADPAKGQSVAKRCGACHTFEQGGGAKVGPNLWDIVGAPHAHMEGFAYSDAIKNLEGDWDFEALNAFLTSPKTYAPGTKMSFAGIKKPEERADLLAYLRTLSDSPVPLPEPPAETAEAGGAAEGAAAPTETDVAEAAPAEATGPETPPAEGEGVPPTEEPAAAEQPAEQQAAAPAGEADGGIAALIASADPANGEKIGKRCAACHSFDKGGPNKVGPNLWDIVGANQAHLSDFKYSNALADLGGTWTYENLDAYLTSPKDYAPGNKMAFAGLKKPEDRADLIAWLRTLSDDPQPLP